MKAALLNEQTDLIETLKNLTTNDIPHVQIYTDGACSGNPGPGGWGAVLSYEGMEMDFSGGEPHTTNNRMEMMAAIQLLETLPIVCKVDLFTDSQYLKDGITRWIINWKQNGWKTSDKKPVKNQDLWVRLDEAIHRHHITWHWIKGHAGHPQNEHADALARNAIIAQKMKMMG
jgi:ribonuclease HI